MLKNAYHQIKVLFELILKNKTDKERTEFAKNINLFSLKILLLFFKGEMKENFCGEVECSLWCINLKRFNVAKKGFSLFGTTK